MTTKKQQARNSLSRKNPLFEKYVNLSRSQQAALVQDLFQNVEDEIAHSRTDTIKLVNMLVAQIPNFVKELERKNFWTYRPQTQILAYPEVLLDPDLGITYSTNALNTQLKNTPLKMYIIASETLDTGVLAYYSQANHSIYMPISYEKVFEQGNFSTSVKISRLTQAIKTEAWLYVLIHEIQHARDFVELQNFDYQHFVAHQSKMAHDFENLYHQKRIDLQRNPKKSQVDITFDDSDNLLAFSDMLRTDVLIFLEHLNTNNQSMLKSSQTKIQAPTIANPISWTALENAFITSKQSQAMGTSSILKNILWRGTAQRPSPSSSSSSSSSTSSSSSKIQKQLNNPDLYVAIQEQIIQALKDYPNSYTNTHNSQKHLSQLENVFRECSSSIRYSSRATIPLDFVGFFQVEGVDFAQRVISAFLNTFKFDANMELPIGEFDMSNINPNWQAILRFRPQLNSILMIGEVYSYRTQEVDEILSDTILGLDKEIARLFHGSTFYQQLFSKFQNLRYLDVHSQAQSLYNQLVGLKFEMSNFIRAALSGLFDSIFQIDFSLVKDTFFDFTSHIKDCTYADLNTTQPYVMVNGKQIDVRATKEQIVELFFLTFEDAFFSKNKAKIVFNLFNDILVGISSVGVFLPTILEKNADLISDTLYEIVTMDSEVKASIDLMDNVAKKASQVKDQIWNTLSFSEKYISNTRTILLSMSQYNHMQKPIGFCLKHKVRMSNLIELYVQQNKQIPLVSGMKKQRLDACLSFLESKAEPIESAINTYVAAIHRFYSVCATDYLNMHPDKKEAKSYIENLAQLHKKWISKVKNAYTIHLKDTKSHKDSSSKAFLAELEPFVDFFYENTVSMVITSNQFDQYIIQPSEESILNFQKLIESRKILSRGIFRKFHNLMFSDLIVNSKVSAQDTIKAQMERDEINSLGIQTYNLQLGDNTENLLYVLRDADQVSDHYKLGIVLSLLSHNLALCTISQFFLENT